MVIRYLAGDHLQDMKLDNMVFGPDRHVYNVDTNFFRHCAHPHQDGKPHSFNAVNVRDASLHPHLYHAPAPYHQRRYSALFDEEGRVDLFTQQGLINIISVGVEDRIHEFLSYQVRRFAQVNGKQLTPEEVQGLFEDQVLGGQPDKEDREDFLKRHLPPNEEIRAEAIAVLIKIANMPEEHIQLLAQKAAEILPEGERKNPKGGLLPSKDAVQGQFLECLKIAKEKAQEVLRAQHVDMPRARGASSSTEVPSEEEVLDSPTGSKQKNWADKVGRALEAPLPVLHPVQQQLK